MYYVVRIRWTGETESHSIEQREDYRAALARFHSVIAADVSAEAVTYCAALLLNDQMQLVVSPFYYSVTTDAIGDPHALFENLVGRVIVDNNGYRNSIEYKNLEEAYKRYFNIIAADLQDENITYNGAFIVDRVGRIIESRSFKRPEPEPEPTPEEPEEPTPEGE